MVFKLWYLCDCIGMVLLPALQESSPSPTPPNLPQVWVTPCEGSFESGPHWSKHKCKIHLNHSDVKESWASHERWHVLVAILTCLVYYACFLTVFGIAGGCFFLQWEPDIIQHIIADGSSCKPMLTCHEEICMHDICNDLRNRRRKKWSYLRQSDSVRPMHLLCHDCTRMHDKQVSGVISVPKTPEMCGGRCTNKYYFAIDNKCGFRTAVVKRSWTVTSFFT